MSYQNIDGLRTHSMWYSFMSFISMSFIIFIINYVFKYNLRSDKHLSSIFNYCLFETCLLQTLITFIISFQFMRCSQINFRQSLTNYVILKSFTHFFQTFISVGIDNI
jgi:hypothetical protein